MCENGVNQGVIVPGTTTSSAIGPLLQRVRLNDARSLESVARDIGVSEHSVARYEHGAEFTVTLLLRWCAALSLTPAEVIRAADQLAAAPEVVASAHPVALGGED